MPFQSEVNDTKTLFFEIRLALTHYLKDSTIKFEMHKYIHI